MQTMTRNQKGSVWYSTPRDKRKRKGIELTLSDAALAKLDELGEKYGSRSEAVERLIMEAK